MRDLQDRLDERIRHVLEEKLGLHRLEQNRNIDFESESARLYAVKVIRARVEQILKLTSKLGSLDAAVSYLKSTAARRKISSFPEYDVPLRNFVTQSESNGLCPLPSRLDCLTGICTSYPDVQPESDLSLENVLSEPIAVLWNERSSTFAESLSLKRLRIKN
jgi:hypothetical protein